MWLDSAASDHHLAGRHPLGGGFGPGPGKRQSASSPEEIAGTGPNPFFSPRVFVVGYAYSNVTLDLVRQPALNELFYDLLLLMGVVPVGTLVLVLAPLPPLGPTAAWCGKTRRTRPASPSRLLQLATTPLVRPSPQPGFPPSD
ncbi:MAG: hypothetical protein Ct9H300mP1_37310 [Planctomycetaceae bacterium]|nr:MAG: hypothetical protein Ct9H300mP1_37310 [Planctomycetaceae bacterium]